MKTTKLVLFALVLISIMSFSRMSKPAQALQSAKKHIVLILRGPMNQEKFSVFEVRQIGDILIGKNQNIEDYFIQDGIYRIEGSSNDKFYHKKILVLGG